MGRLVEFNRIYRRVEASDRGSDVNNPVLPSIEIRGNTSVSVYGSNLPRQASDDQADKYTPPFLEADIATEMTLANSGLQPGFHEACLCTTWIAFVPEATPSAGDEIYDCDLIDWEFEDRRRDQEENIC